MAALALWAPAAQAVPGYDFTNWSGTDGATTTGTLQGRGVTLAGPVNAAGSVFDGTSAAFNSGYFDPELPASDAVEISSTPGSSFSLNLGGPVRNPIIHMYSLASTVTFPPGTIVTKLSGQDAFTVSGNTVSGTLAGQDDSSGTVQLTGIFDSLQFAAAPTFGGPTSVDGIVVQVGLRLPPLHTSIALISRLPERNGSFADFVRARVSATGDVSGGPIETRCVLDPPSAPANFGDLPPSCPFMGTGTNVLAAGAHTLYAASRDYTGGTEAPPVSRTFRIAATPDTTITHGPTGTTWDPAPQFAFSASAASSTFECRVDAGAFASCTSPSATATLSAGAHAFEVRAIGLEGFADRTPARRSFSVNGPSSNALSCEVRPVVVPFFMLQFSRDEQSGCAVGLVPSYGCPRGSVCTSKRVICPTGARCTLTTRADWFDADTYANWGVAAFEGFGGIHAENEAVANTDPHAHARCETGFTGDRCVAIATLTALGTNRPIYIGCATALNAGAGVLGRTTFGTDSVRRIECIGDLGIEPAKPLAAAASGLTGQVNAPAPGVVSVAPAIVGAGTASAAAKASRPAIAKVRKRVTRRGPVAISFTLNRAAKRLLARRKKLVVSLRTTFTPTGGGKTLVAKSRVTLRPPPVAHKRCRHPLRKHC